MDGFFAGTIGGQAPAVWVLVLSQVTTWIFARSLMNAAILGYYYGIAGTLAYAAYYGSFLSGGFIVARLRAQAAGSVQDWLAVRFGTTGTHAYNVVIALRLLSEVFANLLVVGLIAGAVIEGSGTWAIMIVAVVGLAYSAWGAERCAAYRRGADGGVSDGVRHCVSLPCSEPGLFAGRCRHGTRNSGGVEWLGAFGGGRPAGLFLSGP